MKYKVKTYKLAEKTINNLAKIKEETGLSYNLLFTNFINNYMNFKTIKRGGRIEWENIKEGDECRYCRIGQMTMKNGKFGSFWACSNFPGCGFTQAVKK